MIPQFFCLRQQLGITRLSNIWDTLILKKHSLFIWNSDSAQCSVLYLATLRQLHFCWEEISWPRLCSLTQAGSRTSGRCLWEQAPSHPIALVTVTPEQEKTLPSHSTFLSSGTQQIKISPDLFRQKSSKLYLIWSHFFFFLSCREHFMSLGSCSETHEIDTLKVALFWSFSEYMLIQ